MKLPKVIPPNHSKQTISPALLLSIFFSLFDAPQTFPKHFEI